MPRTTPRKPDYERITRMIKSHMLLAGVRFIDLKGRNPESYRRWTNAPNTIRIEDLAMLLTGIGCTREEQEELVINLYRECVQSTRRKQ